MKTQSKQLNRYHYSTIDCPTPYFKGHGFLLEKTEADLFTSILELGGFRVYNGSYTLELAYNDTTFDIEAYQLYGKIRFWVTKEVLDYLKNLDLVCEK